MLAEEANGGRGKAEKAEPQSESVRAAVALAESREAAARDELRAAQAREQEARGELDRLRTAAVPAAAPHDRALMQIADRIEALAATAEQIDRKSVVSGKSVSVRVDLGGSRILKKTKQNTTENDQKSS